MPFKLMKCETWIHFLKIYLLLFFFLLFNLLLFSFFTLSFGISKIFFDNIMKERIKLIESDSKD